MSEETSPYEVSQSGISPIAPPNMDPVMPTAVPKVFGIIHIVYACLGIIVSLLGIVSMFVMKAMMEKMSGDMKEAQMFLDAYDKLMVYTFIDAGLKLILGVVLLAAGIGLLKKKLWAQKMSMFWAVARIVVAAGMIFLTHGVTQEFQESARQIGGNQEEVFQKVMQGIGNVMGVIFIGIYPVLCLVFLSKKKVKDALS